MLKMMKTAITLMGYSGMKKRGLLILCLSIIFLIVYPIIFEGFAGEMGWLYFVWIIKIIPEENINVLMLSALVMSSPGRKRIFVGFMAKLNLILNNLVYFLSLLFYLIRFGLGDLTAEQASAFLLLTAATGGVISVFSKNTLKNYFFSMLGLLGWLYFGAFACWYVTEKLTISVKSVLNGTGLVIAAAVAGWGIILFATAFTYWNSIWCDKKPVSGYACRMYGKRLA